MSDELFRPKEGKSTMHTVNSLEQEHLACALSQLSIKNRVSCRFHGGTSFRIILIPVFFPWTWRSDPHICQPNPSGPVSFKRLWFYLPISLIHTQTFQIRPFILVCRGNAADTWQFFNKKLFSCRGRCSFQTVLGYFHIWNINAVWNNLFSMP